MDRFFSKLDLRDIKIDPEAKFPPDEDAYTESVEADVTPQAEWTNGAESHVAAVAVEAPVQVKRNGEVLKVSARSRPSAVAGAIAGVVRETGRAEVQALARPTRLSRRSRSLATTCSKPASRQFACRLSSMSRSTTRTARPSA